MRILRAWTLMIAVAILGTSCAATSKSGHQESSEEPASRKGPVTKKNLFPRVLNELPKGGVLDLGPVVVGQAVRGLDTMNVLQDVAERIGADAFVLEERRVREAYPVQTKAMSGFVETFDGRIYQFTTYVMRPTGEGGGVKESGFYRALRFVEGDPEGCRLDEDLLATNLLPLFQGIPTLREQIRRLTVLFAKGIIDPETFRQVRKNCLDQVRERPSGEGSAKEAGP